MRFLLPLELGSRTRAVLTVTFMNAEEGRLDVSAAGRVHCSMRFAPTRAAPDFPARTTDGVALADPYRRLLAGGFGYGPCFAQLRRVRVDGARGATADLCRASGLTDLPLCPGHGERSRVQSLFSKNIQIQQLYHLGYTNLVI